MNLLLSIFHLKINWTLICGGYLGALFMGHSAMAQDRQQQLDLFTENLFSITEIMVSDVTAPTGAARFYAYSTLGAYAALHGTDPLHNRFQEPLTIRYPQISKIDTCFAAIYSMLEVGKNIMPSGNRLAETQQGLIKKFRAKKWANNKVLQQSMAYADSIAQQVLAYARTDGYSKLSTLSRYTPKNGPGYWYPTPPAYMMAIDPEWKTIRTFFLDDLSLSSPAPPAPFSLDTTSSFFLQMKEVYDTTRLMNDQQKLVANFWDCNPFVVSYSGHMAIGLKKISPGGHWMGITGIASKKAGLTLSEAIYIHTLVATGLHDAFISCWEEKYRSHRIRPETAINRHLSPEWRPILQTPPFPEYTSGHSVISRTSAVLLTHYFGDNFAYTDTSEEYFGLPARDFQSFLQASEEAAISRLYGGIHFRDAIEVGVKQGDQVAQYILTRIGSSAAQWRMER